MNEFTSKLIDKITRKINYYAGKKPTTSAEWIHVRAKYEAFVEVLKAIESIEKEAGE